MVHSVRIFALLVLSLLAGQAAAEREVHVIAIGRGLPPQNVYASPEAEVLIDRPGKEVALVLLDGGELRWNLQVTDGTRVTAIVLGGRETSQSQVYLSGIPVVGIETPDLPLVFHPWGREFRQLVAAVSARFDVPRLASFHGTHGYRGIPLRITRVNRQTPALSADYLAARVHGSDDLPAAIRDALARGGPTDCAARLGQDGLHITVDGSPRHYPADTELPPILLPSAAICDAGRQIAFGASLGGPGFVYALDLSTDLWSIAARLEGLDVAGLWFDPTTGSLITTGAFSRPGEITVFQADGARRTIFLPTPEFPGLTDLFDFGNEHGPALTPLAYEAGWLLLEAQEARPADATSAPMTRRYAVHLQRREIRLLSYRNP